jgi:methionyl-tRNA synthetase
MEDITYEDFKKLDIRIVKILKAEDHPNADRLYVITFLLGEERRSVVAGIRPYYEKEELEGKYAVVLLNLEARTIRGIESHGMILAASDDESLTILSVDRDIPSGTRVS